MRIIIRVLSWSKHKPRKNYSRLEWIKVYSRVLHDKKLHGATSDVLWTWVGLLLITAEENKDGVIDATEDWVAEELRLRKPDFLKNLCFLQSRGLLSVEHPQEEVSSRNFEKLKVTSEDGSSEKRREEERREEDSDGHSENATSAPAAAPPPQRTRKPKAPPGPSTPAGHVWVAYAEAYRGRYGNDPVRNAKANANCCQLVARLGAENAVATVRFYVEQDGYFATRVHPLDLCVRNAEELHQKRLTGPALDNFALAEAWARQPDPPKPAAPPAAVPPPRQKTPEEIERDKARRAEQLAEMRRIRQEGARGA